MKILIAIASLSAKHGGPSKAAIEKAHALIERGHEVEIFTTDQDGPRHRFDVPTDRPVVRDGVPVHFFRAEILGLWPALSLGFRRAARDRIKEFDIVHSHSLWLFCGLIIGHYCRKHRVPYLISPAGALDPYIFRRHRYRKALLEWLFERRNFRHAAAIHFTTEEEMELARDALPFRKGVVVPLGIRSEDYAVLPGKGSFRKLHPEIGKRRILLFLGRINFKKGLDLLIPALERLVRDKEDVHLVLAGPDEEGFGKKVRGWIARADLGGRVTITGMLQGQAKLAALADADIFVLPSYSENFGIAVVEAMACGLPVVISDKVNIWREVKAAKAGLVSACDAQELARHIRTLLRDPRAGQEMGRNGQALVKRDYCWPAIAERLESTYRAILAAAPMRGTPRAKNLSLDARQRP